MDSFDFFLLILDIAFIGGIVVLYIMWLPILRKCINKAAEQKRISRERRNKR